MNGFTMMADSYKKLMEQGKIDRETAEKEIRIYEFLATCEDDEIGGMQVVSQNGVLGLLSKSIFSQSEDFIDLSTTDLQHCEVVKHGKKED